MMKQKYDVIIIGAGIGGLVCGCYLAKAGMNVLIVEQHSRPGGYCTSFKRRGFVFDAAAHALGGLKNGNLGNIWEDLGVPYENLRRRNPSDVIITPEYEISFWSEIGRTINDLNRYFPNEKSSIHNFFDYMTKQNSKASSMLKSATFLDLMDSFFNDDKLKTILAAPILGNGGLPPSKLSAFMGVKVFREYLLDGGYFFENGMQTLSDALAVRFKAFGGKLLLSTMVNKISIKNYEVEGVIADNEEFYPTKYLVSNADATQTYLKLIGEEIIPSAMKKTLKQMTPSVSAFILYLGLNKTLAKPGRGSNIWVLSHYDIDGIFHNVKRGALTDIEFYLYNLNEARSTITATMYAPYMTKRFWEDNKDKISNAFISRISSDLVPSLVENLSVKVSATPHTLRRFTLNYKGAAFGWECTPAQLALSEFRKPSFVGNFYLSGHWTTKGLGISGVSYVAKDTAKMILRKEKCMITC